MKRRLLAWLLALCLIVGMLPISAVATEQEPAGSSGNSETVANANVWDGTIATAFAGGTGSESDPYQIATGAQLAYLAQEVNKGTSYVGEYFKLTADIDLNNKEWTPIGKVDASFKGTFNGNDKTIYNLKISYTNDENKLNFVGLFGDVSDVDKAGGKDGSYRGTEGVIKNVKLVNVNIKGGQYVGALAGGTEGDIENCSVTGTISIEGNYYVGGLVGCTKYCDVKNCTVGSKDTAGTITGTYVKDDYEGDGVGGLIGCNNTGQLQALSQHATVKDCTVQNVTVSGTRKVGGVIGQCYTGKIIDNCTVDTVTLVCNAVESYASKKTASSGFGGIVGLFSNYESKSTISGTLRNLTIKVKEENVDTVTKYLYVGYISGGQGSSNYPTNGQVNSVNVKIEGVNTLPTGTASFNAAATGNEDTTKNSNVAAVQPYWGWDYDTATEFTIGSLYELEAFRDMVNSGKTFQGKTVYLTEDIDLASVDNWEPIGTASHKFLGTFDGGSHTVSNLKINDTNLEYAGLFGVVGNSASDKGGVNNLTVHNASIKAKASIGAISGNVFVSQISNCHVTGTIQIEGYYKVAGLVGESYVKLVNCSVDGTDKDTSYVKATLFDTTNNLEGDNVGGLGAYLAEDCSDVQNCSVSNITVEGTRKVGGLVGTQYTRRIISGCLVDNVDIICNASNEYITKATTADDNGESDIGKLGIGGLVGQFVKRTGYVGVFTNCSVSNVTISFAEGCTEAIKYMNVGAVSGGQRSDGNGENSNKFWAPDTSIMSVYNIFVSNVTLPDGIKKFDNYNNGIALAVNGATLATVDGYAYTSLQEALDSAEDKTVVLQSDVTVDETIYISTNVTLDLNGHILTGPSSNWAFYLSGDAAVEINNGTINVYEGFYCNGTLTLTAVQLTASGHAIDMDRTAHVTIDENTIVKSSATDTSVYLYYPAGSFANDTESKPQLEVYGTIENTSQNGSAIQGNGQDHVGTIIKIYDGANITANNTAIYLPQTGELTMTGGTVSGYAGIGIKSGTLTITGGTVQGTANDTVLEDKHSSSNGIACDGSAIVIDSNVAYAGSMNVFISDDAKVESAYSTAIREIGSNSGKTNVVSINISGGTVSSGAGMDVIKVRDVTKKTVSITGGTFSTDPTAYLADESYTVTYTTTGTPEVTTYTVGRNEAVAKIGKKTYNSIQEAVTAGGEVVLLRDVALGEDETITVAANTTVTIDFNGHKITKAAEGTTSPDAIVNNGTLTLKDSTAKGNGGVESYQHVIKNNSKLTITSGNYAALDTVNHTEGYDDTTSADAYAGTGARERYVVSNEANATADITGGTLSSIGKLTTVINRTNGTMTVSGDVTISAVVYAAIYNFGKMTITGGTISSKSCSHRGTYPYAVVSSTGGSLTVKGDPTITGVHGALCVSAGTVDIQSGTFTTVKCEDNCTRGDGVLSHYAAYIAGEKDGVSGTISGGVFTSYSKQAVYVGNDGDGGEKKDAYLTITGGVFNGGGSSAAFKAEKTGNLSITGGTFSSDVKEYTAEGYSTTATDNGYTVIKAQKAAETPTQIAVTTKTSSTETKTESVTVSENETVSKALETVAKNEAVNSFATSSVEDATEAKGAYIQAEAKALTVETNGDKTTVTSITYDVKPVQDVVESGSNATTTKEVLNNGNAEFDKPITFRLAVPFGSKDDYVKVTHTHDGETDVRFATILEESGSLYIELAYSKFSEITVEESSEDEMKELSVAEVDGVTYTKLQDAIDAALSSGKTMKLLAKVTENDKVTIPEGKVLYIVLNGYTWAAEGYAGTVQVAVDNPIVKADLKTYTDKDNTVASVDIQKDDTFTVEISANAAFYGADITVEFDSEMLELTNIDNTWEKKADGKYRYYVYNENEATDANTVIGTLTFKALSTGDSNPNAATATIEITNAELTVAHGKMASTKFDASNTSVRIFKTAVTKPTVNDQTYTGQTINSGLSAGTGYTVTTDNGGVNVGTYYATLTLTDGDLYYWDGTTDGSTTATVSYKITAADIPEDWYTAPSANTVTYDGSSQALVTTGAKTTDAKANLVFTYSVVTTGTPADSSYTATNYYATEAGTYIVYYKISAGSNYKTASDSITVVLAAPDYKVVTTEYVPGYTMVYIFTNSEVKFKYTVDDKTTKYFYDITDMGYKLYTDSAENPTYYLTESVTTQGSDGEQAVTTTYTSAGTFTHVYAVLLPQKTTYAAANLSYNKDYAIAGTVTFSAAISDDNKKLDVNGSNTIGIEDAVAICATVNRTAEYVEDYMKTVIRADVDKNGKVELEDANPIKDYCQPIKAD